MGNFRQFDSQFQLKQPTKKVDVDIPKYKRQRSQAKAVLVSPLQNVPVAKMKLRYSKLFENYQNPVQTFIQYPCSEILENNSFSDIQPVRFGACVSSAVAHFGDLEPIRTGLAKEQAQI